jgi:hypothetical protein
MNIADRDRYLAGLAAMLAAEPAVTQDQLRRLYQVMTVLTVGRSKRIDTIKGVFGQRRKRLSKVPKFRDPIVANSMAKDMLTLAVVGVREGRAARFKHTQGILPWPKKRTLSLLAWVGWEHRTIRRVVRGRLPLENPLRVVDLINNCSSNDVEPRALYLTGTRVAFAAVGVPRSGAAAHPNPLMAAAGLEYETAKELFHFLKEGHRTANQAAPNPADWVTHARELRARYLEALAEDEAALRRESAGRRPHLHAAVATLLDDDREPTYRRQPVPKTKTWQTRLREKTDQIVIFANEKLREISPERRADLEAMLRENLIFAVPGDDRLEHLQDEVRQILDEICAADPFARSELYRALEMEAFGRGGRVVRSGPLYDVERAVVLNPVRFSFAWGFGRDGWQEETIPYDLRSALFVELGRVLTRRASHVRVRKCPMCGTYLVATKRQRFCPGPCKADADVIRRRLLRRQKSA